MNADTRTTRRSRSPLDAPISSSQHAPSPPRSTVPYLRLLRDIGKLTHVYEELRDTTGPVTAVKLAPRQVLPPLMVVTSPEGARQVLGGQYGAFDKDARLFVEARRLFRANVLDVTHGAWQPRRRTLQPLFTRRHVASFATHMADAADDLASAWLAAPGGRDLDCELRRLTLAVLGRTLFGRPLDEDALVMAPHVERSLRYLKNRSFIPLRAPGWFPSPLRRRAASSVEVLRTIVSDAVAGRQDATEGDGELIDLLVEATDPETGARMTPEMIVDELIVFLVAGHDTTATTLTAALWLLGHHPEVQEQVAAEAQAIGETVTIADLPRLAVATRVVQEAMRLYPPAAWLPRRTTRDTEICGFHVPQGTDVVVSIWAIHRDPALWPDPRRFDPDRFLPEQAEGRDRWAFLPFGGGPRSCLGDHFAMAEAVIALASIVRRVQVTSTQPEFRLTVPFTLTAKGPIDASVGPRRWSHAHVPDVDPDPLSPRGCPRG